MSTMTLKVNGAVHAVDVEPSTPLLYVLRNDLGLHGPHFGCGLGQCGACAVIIGGVATRSCVTPVSGVKSEITTLKLSHETQAGFREVGTYLRHGRLEGDWRDCVIVERLLGEATDPSA